MKFHLLTNPRHTVWDSTESKIDTFFDFTPNLWQADIWVANQEAPLRENLEKALVLNRKKPKACILWTHEPYFSTTTSSKIKLYDCPVYIFNVWNGRALKQNGTFLFQNFPTSFPLKSQKRSDWRSQGKKTCVLMTYPNSAAPFTQERLSYALSGHEKKGLDIYGKGWPPGYSIENSRDGEWWKSKPGILEKYDYNLALENCIQPHYVSEKLWDSILNGCLPIYCHNGTIYDDFMRHSFLDVRDFRSHEQLWEKIQAMSLSEWNQRYSMCWDAMETLWKRNQQSQETFWKRSIEEIQALLENLT
jgi:hypothetical protein